LVGARRVAKIGALGILGAIAVSCVAIVGADEGFESAVKNLCSCTDLRFIESTCVDDVSRRLEIVSPEARARWMRDANNKRCFEVCTNALECYRTAPVCSKTTCNSDDSNECCDGFACDPTSRECVEQ
jgi:hypothetical protein